MPGPTMEAPLHLGRAVKAACGVYGVAVIDCLTLWLSNLLCDNLDVGEAQADFSMPWGPRTTYRYFCRLERGRHGDRAGKRDRQTIQG